MIKIRHKLFVISIHPNDKTFGLISRYPVAIKCVRKNKRMSVTRAEQNALLEEAKSMLEINKYHDNIVNLQGIAYKKSTENDGLIEVYF